MATYKLVLIRHGESKWNQENRFCGWFDADLSEAGEIEARRGGQALKGEAEPPSCVESNALLRLHKSLWVREPDALHPQRTWRDKVHFYSGSRI